LLDAAGGDTGKLKVTATGEWTLTIRPASTATAFDSAARGSGDAVLTYTGRKGKIAFTHSGHSIFFVLTHGTSTPRLVVNKKGNYQGKAKIGNGPILIQITTVGPWTAKATAT
jgi:hypothetical protein